MVAERETPTPSNTSGGRIGQGEYAEAVAEHVRGLWGVSILGITLVSGTDDLVGTVTPAIDGPYTSGMAFWLTPDEDNTGPMTLDLGQGAEDLVGQDGSAFEEGEIVGGTTYLLLYTGTEFRVQNAGSASGGSSGSALSLVRTIFTASGSWSKNPNLVFAIVHVVGGGGGAGSGGTGLGGTSSFGSHCSATGGSGNHTAIGGTPGVGSGGDINMTGARGIHYGTDAAASGGAAPGPFGGKATVNQSTGGQTGNNYGGGAASDVVSTDRFGCGGGYSTKVISAAALADSETVTVGAGGVSTGTGSANGAPGIVVVEEFLVSVG
jgi:hypothetical protein